MISRKYTLSALTLLAAFLLLKYDRIAADAAFSALSTCIRQVIPPLFPYMVLSSFILALDLAEPLYRFIPMSVFRLPSCTAPVFLTGLLCGFPVGAAGCASLYESGRITKHEASRLCALSSHTSPAFLIGTVGTLWGSKKFGVTLYLSSLVFALISGAVLRSYHAEKRSYSRAASLVPTPKAVPAFCKAVTDAASSCLAVTGFIVFFRVACAAASAVAPSLSVIFSAVFEFSSGAVRGAEISGIGGAALTGFAVGFSGFSVFMQLQKYLSVNEIPFAPVFVVKLIEGFFTAAVAVIFCRLSPMHPAADALSSEVTLTPAALLIPLLVLVILHFAGRFLIGGKPAVG